MAGYSEEVICPYCRNSATYNHESRGKYRGETQECYVCGWNTYSRADLWDEDEDAPEEYEYIPDNEIIPLAKILTPFISFVTDEIFINNIILGSLIPQLLKEENWYKLIDVIFGNYSIIIEEK